MFRIGDRVKTTKEKEGLRLGTVGTVVCIPYQGYATRTKRIGVDFGFESPYTSDLHYIDSGGQYHKALSSRTGMFVFQSYLALSGPPDGEDDWI